MQKFRAIFMLIVFLTSFGRCWAEQYGLLDGSELACCPAEVHTSSLQNQDSQVEHHHHEHEHDDSHDCPSQDSAPEPQNPASPSPPDNAPCEVCNLIQSGFAGSPVLVEIPTQIFSFANLPTFSEWRVFLCNSFTWPADELSASDPPDQYYPLPTSELATSSTVSVRGPNLK
jgi:hypothetical protein